MSLWKRAGGGPADATLKYKTLLLGNPKNVEAHTHLGLHYYKEALQNEESDSSSSSDGDEEEDSSRRRRRRARQTPLNAKTKENIRSLEQACHHLVAAVENGMNTGEVWFSLGMAQHTLWEYTWDDTVDEDGDGVDDRLQEAQTSFQNAFKFPMFLTNAKLYLQVAIVYEDFGTFEGALQMYAHIVTTFPDYPAMGQVLLRAAALCMHPNVQMMDEAVKYWEFLLDNPPVPYTTGSILFQLGRAYQLQGGNNARKSDECFREAYMQEHSVSLGKAAQHYKQWTRDPQTWRRRAVFHRDNKLHVLAADAYLMAIRLGDDDDPALYFQLALVLRRMLVKSQGQQCMERAHMLDPYNVVYRNKLKIYSLDVWRPRLEHQDRSATKIQARVRGINGRKIGLPFLVTERAYRWKRNRAATTIQSWWRFLTFRWTLRRQRYLVGKSLGRIRLRRAEHAVERWVEWADGHRVWRLRRLRAALHIERWYRGQQARVEYERVKRANEAKVQRMARKIHLRLAYTSIKAWESYVVWIIDVKEPFFATSIQRWYRHIKWRVQFLYQRRLVLQSLENIRIHTLASTLHQLRKMCVFQRMTRVNRRHRRRDKFARALSVWRWWACEHVVWWRTVRKPILQKDVRYQAFLAAENLVNRRDLNIDPAPVGASFVATDDDRQENGIRRATDMFWKLVQIWGNVYGQGGERQLSFMNARLPKDTYFRASSKYFAKDIQTSILRKEMERHHAPVHPIKAQALELEQKFVETHWAAIRAVPKPLDPAIVALTLPSNLRKLSGGFDSTLGRKAKLRMKAKRLTGRNTAVHLKPFGGAGLDHPPRTEKEEHQRFWGFPEWYGPGMYGTIETRKRRLPGLQEQQMERAELLRMRKEEAGQREVDLRRLVASKEADYLRFKDTAVICGPMAPRLFFTCSMPGRLYGQMVYTAVSRVQLWWKLLIPVRRERKLHGAITIQKTFRASQGRHRVVLMHKIARSLGRIRNRVMASCYAQWKQTWRTMSVARRMMRRAMNMQLTVRWNAWHEVVLGAKKGRLEKVRRVMNKMRNAKKWRILAAWYEYVQRLWQVKKMMWRAMAGIKEYCFDVWHDNVTDILRHRLEMKAATDMQRWFRGKLGRNKFAWVKFRRTRLANHLQRIVRGFLGRVRTRYRRIELALEERKSERRKMWEDDRCQREAARCAEETRNNEEAAHVRMAHVKAIEDHAAATEVSATRKKSMPYTAAEKARARDILRGTEENMRAQLRRKEELAALKDPTMAATKPFQKAAVTLELIASGDGEVLTRGEALHRARQELRLECAIIAGQKARVAYRQVHPPRFSCEECHVTFFDEHMCEVHLCSTAINPRNGLETDHLFNSHGHLLHAVTPGTREKTLL
jgi:tetratricopeptide (TPR) repeat protein